MRFQRLNPGSPLRRTRLGFQLSLAAAAAVVWGSPPLWTQYHLVRARSELKNRDVDRALAHLRHAGLFDAENAERRFLLARAARRQGQMEAMHAHLERAARLGYDREALRREEVLLRAQAGLLSQAEPHLSSLLRDPRGDAPEICEVFVDAYFAAYRFENAFTLLDGWEADFPKDPQPHVFRGLYHEHGGRAAEAAASYRRALELAPQRVDVRERLARQLMTLHEYDAAAEAFRICLARRPDNPDVRAGWAACLEAMGRTGEARRVFEDVLASHPDHYDARLALARLDHASEHASQALARLAALCRERPTNTEARYLLARCLHAEGQIEAAKPHFQFAAEARLRMAEVPRLQQQVRSNPNDVELRYRIGATLIEYDVPEHGAAWLHSVLQIDPHHRPTHAALARYYASIGQEDAAERHRRLTADPEKDP
ncbi:MAG TPA: tetratricopeptide repeat protein [Planctomycetaceae bacterium]|nr:tetratricopeptide repeat protein [Planctomycetaceae bacterium]